MTTVKMEFRRRSIFRQGLSFVITLPIDWVRNQGVKAGDTVVPVLLENGNLLLKLKEEEP